MCMAYKTIEYWKNKLDNCPICKHISSQVNFIDTVKYYNQPLSLLAKSADENEKTNLRKSFQKFIETNPTYSSVFNSLSDENKEWILDYLSGEKNKIT